VKHLTGTWINVSEQAGIATVAMRRPPANAIDIPFLEQLDDVLTTIEQRPDISAMVLTGSDKVFSAGLDLKRMPDFSRAQQNRLIAVLNQALCRLYAMPMPVVAAMNGHAIAGGLVLALACDHRVAVDQDALFGLTEVRVGVPYPQAAITIVQTELAPAVARELVLVGKNHDPAEALALGMVDELRPADAVLQRSLALAQELGGAPRQGYRAIKHQLRRAALAEIQRAIADKDPLHDNWLSSETKAAAARMLQNRR
jgi:enoyl-CoA hydratase